jgi:AcrR family transcriptional regulator
MTEAQPDVEQLMTRQRLLEAAGEVFAEHGFRSATVRDICKRAGANIAAIKYHFGDKEQLYAAAVTYAHHCSKRYPVDEGLGDRPTPQQRLHVFVRAMLMGILEEGKPAWHARLMAREMAEPTAVLDQIAEQGVKPRLVVLRGIVRDFIGEEAPEAVVRRCARSIVGQVLFYHFARPMLERVFSDERFDASQVDALAAHITAFSIGGLKGMKAKSMGEMPVPRKKAGRR